MTPPGQRPRLRVLVVDDSAFARKVMRETLASRANIEVVDIARDGLEALEKISALRPDVVTLDLMMPQLDGIGVLKGLPQGFLPSQVVVVSFGDVASEMGVEALQLGAFGLVHKPTNLAVDRLFEIGAELVEMVEAAGAARARPPLVREAPRAPPRSSSGKRIVVIGTSTGGPLALSRVLSHLPADFPVPIAAVVHIPVGFTFELAHRLDQDSALEVVEASNDLELRPGRAVVARAGVHLKLRPVAGGACCLLDPSPTRSHHRPSVDVLFESAGRAFGADALGVVLTGMGEDGVEGSRVIHGGGGVILAESAQSCVVYGMPRAVTEAGLVAEQAPIDEMASMIQRYV